MHGNKLNFGFDKSSKSFFHPLVCPTCSTEIKNSQDSSSMRDSSSIDFCTECNTPFEWYQIPSQKNLYWLRRSGQRFCTLTGKDMNGKSLLDSVEFGGGNFRNSSVFDPYSKVFEKLDPYHCYKFCLDQKSSFYGKIRDSDFETDESKSLEKSEGQKDNINQFITGNDGEKIIALNIVNGFLVSCTNRGELQVFSSIISPTSSDPVNMKKVENPQPWQKNVEVLFSPVFCGMYSMTVAYSLDNNASLLNFRIVNAIRQAALNENEVFFDPKTINLEELKVFGPPFTLEIDGEPKFAVWCGKREQRSSDRSRPPIFTVLQSQLRIFSVAGELEYIILAPNMARVPLFIRSKKMLISMSTSFEVLHFDLDTLSNDSDSNLEYKFKSFVINSNATYLLPSIFPTMVAVLNEHGHEDIWIAYNEIEHFQIGFYSISIRADKSFSENIPFSSGIAKTQNNDLGELYALSIGHGSLSPRSDHYSNYLAISTSKCCRVYSKSTLSQVGFDINKDDYASMSITGTTEPAMFTGAGILVHLAGQVRLDFCTQPEKKRRNVVTTDIPDWNNLPHHKRMGSSYHTGMALLGRRLFVAHNLGIFVFDFVKQNIEKNNTKENTP